MTAPQDDVFARIARLTEIRLRVADDPLLGCVTIQADGLDEVSDVTCLLTEHAGLDLALRLTQACARLRKAKHGQPPEGAGPLSSTF